MIISIYKCDMCKKEFRDAKSMYEPKNGLCMEIRGLLKARFKINETCVGCFESIRNTIHKAVTDMIVVD
jgi:hypothetical protein